MAKKNADTNYNTNLASEYLMMSLLCRAGKDAYLSLGNKKGVDIIVKTEKGAICVVEVKGVNDKHVPWPVGTKGILPQADNLFYALVCYNSKIANLIESAEFWLIPSNQLVHFEVDSKGNTVYLLKTKIRKHYGEYRNTFLFLDSYLCNN